jgi:hypothetical protein
MDSLPYTRDFLPLNLAFNETYVKEMWSLEFVATVELRGSEEQPSRVEVWADTGSGMKPIAIREVRHWEIFSFNYVIGEGYFPMQIIPVLGESELISVLAAVPI